MTTPRPSQQRRKATLGTVRKRGNRWRAFYERHVQIHTPGRTFPTEAAAWVWLRSEQSLIDQGDWTPPAVRRAEARAEVVADKLTLESYARTWMENRTTPRGGALAPKTKYEYERYLKGRLQPLADLPLASVTRSDVDEWWLANADVPTLRHHIYAFLASVMADASDRELISENPCRVQHAGSRTTKRSKHAQNELIAELGHLEVATLADAMPERHKALLLLLAYSGLRPGETLALTRRDIRRGTSMEGVPRWSVSVTKAVSTGGIGPTKTPESIRTVPLPPHIAGALGKHLERWAGHGDEGLLFQSSHAGQQFATLGQVVGSNGKGKGATLSGFSAARVAIARPELRLYDFRRWARHTWRQAGISEYECERLLGHKLGAVTGAYFTLDVNTLWPYMERIAEQAGWQPPVTTVTLDAGNRAPSALGSLLAALDDETLAQSLSTVEAARMPEVVSLLPPERIATVMTMMAQRLSRGAPNSG